MKKYLVIVVVALSFLAFEGQASAAAKGGSDVEVDVTLSYATEPASGFGSTVGIGVGATIDMTDRTRLAPRGGLFGLRGDITYFNWERDFFGIEAEYTRLMFFGGGRFSFPAGSNNAVRPYAEAGLELSFDEAEVVVPPFGKASDSEINLGLAGGGGVEFLLGNNLKLGVSGRLHLITDSFLSLGVSLGVGF